jgi:hypothetical protein
MNAADSRTETEIDPARRLFLTPARLPRRVGQQSLRRSSDLGGFTTPCLVMSSSA